MILRGDNLPVFVGGQLLDDVASLLITCSTVLPVETTVKLVTSVSIHGLLSTMGISLYSKSWVILLLLGILVCVRIDTASVQNREKVKWGWKCVSDCSNDCIDSILDTG